MRVYLLYLLLICCSSLLSVVAINTIQLHATKGKFFIHQLHSGSLFRQTVNVKWSATLKNKPALPQWLKLVPSRHKPIAFLVGTPVTPLGQVTVHIMAKREDNFQIEQSFLVITLEEDIRYSRSTEQVLEVTVNNYDAETLFIDRTGLIGQLENSVKESFKGKNVNPYIYSIEPEVVVPLEKEHLFRNQKIGSVVSIGTQRGFYSNAYNLVQNLRSNNGYCKRNSKVPLDKYFAPKFQMDWCKTDLKNVSLTYDANGNLERTTKKMFGMTSTEQAVVPTVLPVETSLPQPPPEVQTVDGGFTFWESVLLFPLIAVLCIVLVLILSMIFFGRREGQKWRDYKTPREQLEEYASVRESQRHLRELSVQRQLLHMANDRSSNAPSGIHSFLQPKAQSLARRSASLARISKSASHLHDRNDDTMELLPTESVPVGKQTVAEAARQCGSSLHLYRNPLESETDDEGEESDSGDERNNEI